MDLITRENIQKQVQTYTYHAFHYVDWDEIMHFERVHIDHEGLFVYGFRKDHHIHELIWAVNHLHTLINYSKHYPNALLSFIPRDWKDELIKHGYHEYGVIRDYWLNDLSSFHESSFLQQLTIKDAQEISDITKDCLMLSREFHGESYHDVIAWITNQDYYLQEVKARDTAIFGYHVNDHLVGVIFVSIYGDSSPRGPVLWVREIAVKRDYQGQGIGRKLMKHALCYGNQKGAMRSFLAADDLNHSAIHLYMSMGYTPNVDEEQIDMMTPSEKRDKQ